MPSHETGGEVSLVSSGVRDGNCMLGNEVVPLLVEATVLLLANLCGCGLHSPERLYDLVPLLFTQRANLFANSSLLWVGVSGLTNGAVEGFEGEGSSGGWLSVSADDRVVRQQVRAPDPRTSPWDRDGAQTVQSSSVLFVVVSLAGNRNSHVASGVRIVVDWSLTGGDCRISAGSRPLVEVVTLSEPVGVELGVLSLAVGGECSSGVTVCSSIVRSAALGSVWTTVDYLAFPVRV